jgi:hypothetical protein
VHDGSTVGHEVLQGDGVAEISFYQACAPGGEMCGFGGISDQRADLEALLQQALAQAGTDKPRRAGNGDQAAFGDQADATLSRTSAVAASRRSVSLLLIKSRRALARDSLPDDVRGREWIGTSST